MKSYKKFDEKDDLKVTGNREKFYIGFFAQIFFGGQYIYVKVTDQSNIAMFWVKKLISQPTVPAEPPFFEQIILTH